MQRLSLLCLRPTASRLVMGTGLSAVRPSYRFASGEAAGKDAGASEKPHPTQKVDKGDPSWNNQTANKATAVVLALALALFVMSETGMLPSNFGQGHIDSAEGGQSDKKDDNGGKPIKVGHLLKEKE